MSRDINDEGVPDLTEGVPLADLREGEPFLGRLGEKRLIMVRRGQEVFAIGATCTHYGGPLGEGLVIGETVRCPWHHACFSLRTGEAVGAPAMNPVPRWPVEVRNDRVFVGEKKEASPLATFGRRSEGPESVVVVGAGAAGSAAAEMLRREGYNGPITMVDPDIHAPYDRPNLSKDFLAGNAPEEWIPIRGAGFYAEHSIERSAAAVERIDAHARVVRLSDGTELPYGVLLLATGSRPTRLPIPGGDLPHVHVLRSFGDCRAIIEAAESAQRVAVLGASFIGMEVAASLRKRGLEVTVVAPETTPFERTLGIELGTLIRRAHEKHGVRFRLGHVGAKVEIGRLVLDDGSAVPADLVVVGVGVKPDVALAEAAGARIDNGVIVDAHFQTSVPHIFAVGDIARYPYHVTGDHIRVEHWVAAQRQGQAVARNILGDRRPFSDPPFFWTHQWEVSIAYVGYAGRWENVEVDGDLRSGDATVRYLVGGEVRAVATMGRDLESLAAEAQMASGTPADPIAARVR